MIPVLIIPVIRDFDLLEQLLAAIDEPIERLVIVDNSLSGYVAPHPSAVHIRPILGLGYPGGINAGIAQTPDAPWWMWANADLLFGPGDLAAIAGRFEGVETPRMVTGSHRGLRNAYGAMNRAAVETVGLFDEWAFYPIYFDDDDMEHRCRLGGVEWVTYDGSIRHAGSATIRDPVFGAANSRTFPLNYRHYLKKWGGGPGAEVFRTPYNLPVPLSYTRPDPAARAARRW
jgi:GT2 family glycosyltransferase